MRVRLAVLPVVLALWLAACETGGPAQRVVTDPAYDTVLTTTVQELDAYWADAFSRISSTAYQPMPDENLSAYYPGQSPDLGACSVPEGQEASNAFACDRHIAWDESWLWELWKSFGRWAPSEVMAHEWGHYIQELRGANYPYDIQQELQADCYAGAFTAATAADGSPSVDELVGTVLAIRDLPFGGPSDNPEYPWTAEQNHGTGPERTLAFGIGYASGDPVHCEELGQFQRVPRLALGGGFALDVPNHTTSEALSDGTQRLGFAERQIDTRVDIGYRDFLAQPLDEASIATYATQLLGPAHERLEAATYQLADAQAARVRYQQTLTDGSVVHGLLLISVGPQGGGISVDAYEPGPAPEDPLAWRTINGMALLAQLGIVEP
jgi:predicted metalloprotease